jgi:hypothetical protein
MWERTDRPRRFPRLEHRMAGGGGRAHGRDWREGGHGAVQCGAAMGKRRNRRHARPHGRTDGRTERTTSSRRVTRIGSHRHSASIFQVCVRLGASSARPASEERKAQTAGIGLIGECRVKRECESTDQPLSQRSYAAPHGPDVFRSAGPGERSGVARWRSSAQEPICAHGDGNHVCRRQIVYKVQLCVTLIARLCGIQFDALGTRKVRGRRRSSADRRLTAGRP